jgi:hypothetical protein
MHAADDRDYSRFQQIAAWMNVVAGFLVFVLRYASPRPSFDVHRNLFFVGLLIMFGALASVIASDGNASRNFWPAVNAIAAAWLIVSVGLIPSVATVASIQLLLGAVIGLVALASIVAGPLTIRYRRRRARLN